MSDVPLKEVLTDAIRYWEPRRIAYNIVLVVVAASVFSWNWPASVSRMRSDQFQRVFVLAVLANAAYVVDVAARLSAFRPT